MRHISYIRKILRPAYGSKEDSCTIDVLDFATLSVGRKNSTTPWSATDNLTIVASILRSKSKSSDDEEPINTTLLVFWLERYDAVVKDLLLSETAQRKNLGFVSTQSSDRTSKTILKGELWSLCHHNSVISASWKKNRNAPTPVHKLFLVTLTKKYMAYIWRFNEMKDSFEICIQIALQNVNYDLNFQCLWMNIESEVLDYNFSSRAFIIFYNTTTASHYSIVTNEQDSMARPDLNLNVEEDVRHSYLCDYFNSMDLKTDVEECLWETDHEDKEDEEEEESTGASQDENIVFGRYDDYAQYFEIYGIDGLYNYQLAVTSEYILGSNEITMPIKIKSIESVVMCNHTFETGLVTLYTSETLRPNKITTKFPISVSKWITLKSTNLSNFYSAMSNKESSLTGSDVGSDNTTAKEEESGYNDVLDELIGMQISKGLNKIIPPINLNVLNENDVTINLLLSPYDLFLKDEHIKESVDNIVGLVIRYMFHPSTPLYLKVNEQFVYIENYFISKIKSSKKVKNVKVFSDKDETLYIIHSFSGKLSALTSKKHDPNDITYHKIHNLRFVSTFQVVEYHHQLYFIVFSPHGLESQRDYGNPESARAQEDGRGTVGEDGLYNCGFYKWENYKLNMKGQWLFKSPNVQPGKHFSCYGESVQMSGTYKNVGSRHSPTLKPIDRLNVSSTTRVETAATQYSSSIKRPPYDHNAPETPGQSNFDKCSPDKGEERASQFSDDDPYMKYGNSVASDRRIGRQTSPQNGVSRQYNRSGEDRRYMGSSWSDHQDDQVADAVLQFKKWCDSNYFCLLSKFKLITEFEEEERCDESEESGAEDVIYLYLIRRHKIVKWMEIKESYYYDFLTKNKYFLENHEDRKEYVLGDLKILIKGRRVSEELSESERMLLAEESEVLDELPLFMGCHFKNKMYPVYHPETVLTIYKLGLNNIASKLINMLVFVYRKTLNQLNNEVYCINADPYDSSSADSRERVDAEEMGEYGVSSCNCIIFKTLSLKLFCKFNRFFFDYVVKSLYTTSTHTSHIGFSPITNIYAEDKEVDEAKKKNILYDYVVDDEFNEYFNEYSNFKQDDELLVKELIVYLQVIRLIGLTWYEQYQLINVLIKYTAKGENLLIFNTDSDMDSFVGTVGTSDEEDDENEESCNLCVNSKVVLKMGMEQTSNKLGADNNVLSALMLYMASTSGGSSYYNTNRSAAELEAVFLNKYKEYLRTKYDEKRQLLRNNPLMSSGEEEDEEDNSLIWLLLIKNDHHLFVELNEYHKKELEPLGGKNEEHKVDYMEYLDEVKVGYWIKNKETYKLLFEEVEKYFRLKVKSYKNIEDFDQFGLYLMLQGKVKIYSMLLKTKGFEKFANFLTNDFSLERWKDASVKNAFALISQRRYLLSSAMLILANRVQDAIDVIHQYLGNMSLCILLAKLYEFDLGYVFKKVQNMKAQYVLLHTHAMELPKSGRYEEASPGGGPASVLGRGRATEEEELSMEVEQLCNEETRAGVGSEPDREANLLELLDGDVDELIINVSIGIVLKSLDMHQVEQMIRRSSQYYLDKTPIISVLLHSLLNSYTSWDKILIYAANFLHFQKFDNFDEHDYLDYATQSFTESYCNNYYYEDDYKYLDGNVLVEFNNFEFKRPHSKCPVLRTLSSIIPARYSSKQIKYSYHSSSMVSMSSGHTSQYAGQTLEDAEAEYLSKDTGYMASDSDLIVNVNTLSVVESLLKIKSNLNMELTLTYYKINSNISVRNYDLDIESVYTRLVNTFIGFLDSDLQVENLNIPSLLLNLIHKLSLLTIYSSNLNNPDEVTPTTFENRDDLEAKVESSNRLDVGLYDSDLKLVNDEIVCVCFVVALSCIFVLMMYKVDILPQVYNGLYTQLTLLNQMKGNGEWLAQFLESAIKTVEPSLFTNNVYNIDKLNIVIERTMEGPRHGEGSYTGSGGGEELDE
ncbi:conserved hypothetical protein [Theileria orientalis strain Shintoku]|uniref:RAVE complex protein Rav1 C-terminal domain-containing protein n=1 Tax=Theileria orientalis strain Shintoku TaxID=869250 RepID=J4C3W0_THEOR|nr:conserved hypothetical protein [Theileria orientalis strain Shintoku]BAM41121.1 conserved hypothetical protein [Theileria orientalis strain Shintoku]|eukprot:XP_009691422.1 conserved hypothetical protein [Theileria orientalis strain Shintoku]